jgi:hypothetical protein
MVREKRPHGDEDLDELEVIALFRAARLSGNPDALADMERRFPEMAARLAATSERLETYKREAPRAPYGGEIWHGWHFPKGGGAGSEHRFGDGPGCSTCTARSSAQILEFPRR